MTEWFGLARSFINEVLIQILLRLTLRIAILRVLKKSATATLLPVREGSEVVVATIFNFYRFYKNETGSISVIVKSMKSLMNEMQHEL